jgi:hypothetical protein
MKLYRRILLLTLTLLLLVSATGMSVGLHLCGGKVRDLSFFGQATDCPMEHKEQALPPCHAPKEDQSPEKKCCEQHQLVLDSIEEATGNQAQLLTKTQELQVLAAVQVLIRHLWAPATGPKPAYALYASPPIARDIPVLVQSFRL